MSDPIQTIMPNLDEVADKIATKTWLASKQIEQDVNILRRQIWINQRQRRFFCVIGFALMATSEITDSMIGLSIGVGFVCLTAIGVWSQRRGNRVRAWFAGMQNV